MARQSVRLLCLRQCAVSVFKTGVILKRFRPMPHYVPSHSHEDNLGTGVVPKRGTLYLPATQSHVCQDLTVITLCQSPPLC